MGNRLHKTGPSDSGFSMTELLVVLGIIGVMSAISLPYIVNSKKAYKSEDQALKVIDGMREAGQLALVRRRTVRFEIDLTDNLALIIDENNAAPDLLVRSIELEPQSSVRTDVIPAGVSKPNPPNFNDIAAVAATRGHVRNGTAVNGHSVMVLRFQSDGSVVGNTDVPLNGNIYFWTPVSPGSTTPKNKSEVRALTISGGAAAIRYWKHNGNTFVPNQ